MDWDAGRLVGIGGAVLHSVTTSQAPKCITRPLPLMKMHHITRVLPVITCLIVFISGNLHAIGLGPDEILVAAWLSTAYSTTGIVKVNTHTGAQTLVSQGGMLADMAGLLYETPDTVLASTPGWGNAGKLIRVNVTTGQQTLVAGDLGQSLSAAIGHDGNLYTQNEGWYGPQGNMWQIDAASGNKTWFSSGGRPGHIISHSDGSIYFTGAPYPWDGGSPWIGKLDLATGNWVYVTTGGLLSSPAFMAEDLNGDIIIADCGDMYDTTDSKVIRLNRSTGEQTLVSSGQGFNLVGLWISPTGTIYTTDWGNSAQTSGSGVFTIDRDDGTLTAVSTGGYLLSAISIVGSPRSVADEASTMLLLLFAMLLIAAATLNGSGKQPSRATPRVC